MRWLEHASHQTAEVQNRVYCHRQEMVLRSCYRVARTRKSMHPVFPLHCSSVSPWRVVRAQGGTVLPYLVSVRHSFRGRCKPDELSTCLIPIKDQHHDPYNIDFQEYKTSYELTSITVIEQGRKRSASFIWTLWTRPKIFAVPTPRASPENRWSNKRIMLHICIG